MSNDVAGRLDRLHAGHPWLAGLILGIVLAGLAAAADAAFGGNVSWIAVVLIALLPVALVAVTAGRRRRTGDEPA